MGRMRILGVAVAVVVATGGCAWVGRVGLSSTGAQPGGGTSTGTDVSPNGRFVVFSSDAANLVPNDTNNSADVFLRDNQLNTTERVSLGTAGVQGDAGGFQGLVSADGRYVAFSSDSTNLVVSDTNASTDVFLRDRQLATTTRVSVRTAGGQSDGASFLQSMTPDATLIVFASDATNLIGTVDQNFSTDIYLRDRTANKTTRVSVATDGTEGDSDSSVASISDNGRFVAFISNASTFDPNDSGVFADVFLRDRTAATTTRLTAFPDTTEADGDSSNVAISGDGSTVVFDSDATNLVTPADGNGTTDVYAVTVATGTIERISANASGGDASNFSFLAGVSDNGRFVAFQSAAKNLIPMPLVAQVDSFVRDRSSGSIALVGKTQAQGEPSNPDPVLAGSSPNAISGDGRYVLFTSSATDVLGAPDTNGTVADVFLGSNPVPYLFLATPSTVARGTTTTISLQGSGLHAGSLVLMGDGVTVNSVTPVSESRLDVNVTVAFDAAVGPRMPFVVDNGTGAGAFTGGLTFFPGLYSVI